MKNFTLSRNIFWLFIFAFAVCSVTAQDAPQPLSQDSQFEKTVLKSETDNSSVQTKSDLPDDASAAKIVHRLPTLPTVAKDREWGFYGGSFTFHKDLRGESQKAPVFITGIRYAWSLKNNEKRRLRYYVDFNPLIVVNYREKRLIQTSPEIFNGERQTVFGIGFTPFGLQHNWRNTKKFQPFIAGGIGIALFNKKFPDNRSALEPDALGNRFQVMPDFGAGLEIRQSPRKSYFIGYKYHHLSNAYTAPINVGYNTNMIYGGMYIMR